MTNRYDVAILGAGISGLTAAFWLKEAGFSVVCLEASDHPGGSITTWAGEGFRFELGPNTVLNNALEIDRLCEAAGILGERINAAPASKKRFIVKDGKLLALPGGPVGFLTTPLFSAGAKLRLLKEPFIGRASKEETIAQFVRRRLGEELLQYAVGPFVSGVYAGDPEKLSVRHATAKIYALEEKHGSLIRGAIAKRKGPAPAGGLFSFPEGLGYLPATLATSLGGGYSPNTSVVSVEAAGDGYTVRARTASGEPREISARAVVSALPAKAAGPALAPLGGDFPSRIPALPYADVALVCMGFRRDQIAHPLDGFGFLAPEVEGRHVLGCLFTSSLFPDRAPEGHVALSAFVGGAMHGDRVAVPEEEIVRRTVEDLRPLLGITGEPVLTRVVAWRPAIPQYVVGHGANKEAAGVFEASCPGVFISGNLLYGVSVGDCIKNATAVAGRVGEFLGRPGAGSR
jgi:protoporphyrinogen/coproporphyrinogen III oxidase